jgi:uncharacterized membrane protein
MGRESKRRSARREPVASFPPKAGAAVHVLFLIGVIGKGVDGLLETLGGLMLLIVTPGQLQSLAQALTLHELSRDPNDLIATYILNGAEGLSADTERFAAMYLLWHGAVKIVLVAALLRKREWGYLAGIAAFSLFLVYQVYRYLHTRSPELLALSVIDVFVIVLTWVEYNRLRAANGFARSST